MNLLYIFGRFARPRRAEATALQRLGPDCAHDAGTLDWGGRSGTGFASSAWVGRANWMTTPGRWITRHRVTSYDDQRGRPDSTMCNHSFTVARGNLPRTWRERCPYPDYYDGVLLAASSTQREEMPPPLPLDDSGACIFHSHEVEWKRNNDFQGHFLRLVRSLNSDTAVKWYDFAEFVFVGDGVRTTGVPERPIFRIEDKIFLKQAYFTGASFIDAVELQGIDFKEGADFRGAVFAGDLTIRKSRFFGAEFSKAQFRQCVHLASVEFASYAIFDHAQFTGPTTGSGYVVTIKDSRFDNITSFYDAAFVHGDEAVGIIDTCFADAVDFTETQFRCHLVFKDVSFAGKTDFIDTTFDTVTSAARYRGSAVEFNRIEVTAEGVLTFMSTDPQNKMFHHDVQMSFKENSAGVIRFENVNFSQLTTDSRDRLTRLSKMGMVEIGSGCIKYRHQTDIRKLSISEGNAPLVIDLCHTFTNYFTVCNGLNLGFEIVDRSTTELSFFYFTDEDISAATFRDRLAETEHSLWSLLSTGENVRLVRVDTRASAALSTGNEDALINAVDAIATVFGMFWRVGIRVVRGSWKAHDTRTLLRAIDSNDDETAERRALSLHDVITNNYTYRKLSDFQERQNAGLLTMEAGQRQLDFAIVTAIEVERRAVCEVFGLGDEDRVKRDGRVYWRRDLALPNGRTCRLVVGQPLDMGNVEAALLAADVIRHWSPKAILFVGIAASTDPEKVKLGDVVVGKSVWYYEHGKVTPHGTKPQPEMIQADSGLLKHLVALPVWNGAPPVARPDSTDVKPKMCLGVIACGEKVIANEAVRDQIASGNRQIVALEMEGYGFSRAVWQSASQVRHLVVRGICDDGTSAKDDRWHEYAAGAAATFVEHFVVDWSL